MARAAAPPTQWRFRPGLRSPNLGSLEPLRVAVSAWSSAGMVRGCPALLPPPRQSWAPSATYHRQVARTALDGRNLPDAPARLPSLVPAAAGRSGPAGFLSADPGIILAPLREALARKALWRARTAPDRGDRHSPCNRRRFGRRAARGRNPCALPRRDRPRRPH